jgi:hypothetical protein
VQWRRSNPPAYVITETTVTDPDGFKEFASGWPEYLPLWQQDKGAVTAVVVAAIFALLFVPFENAPHGPSSAVRST